MYLDGGGSSMWGDAVLPPISDSELLGATFLCFGLDKTESRYNKSLVSMARVSDLGVMTSELSPHVTRSAVLPQSTISSSSMVLLSPSLYELVMVRIS